VGGDGRAEAHGLRRRSSRTAPAWAVTFRLVVESSTLGEECLLARGNAELGNPTFPAQGAFLWISKPGRPAYRWL
jgi:hypothetical protein